VSGRGAVALIGVVGASCSLSCSAAPGEPSPVAAPSGGVATLGGNGGAPAGGVATGSSTGGGQAPAGGAGAASTTGGAPPGGGSLTDGGTALTGGIETTGGAGTGALAPAGGNDSGGAPPAGGGVTGGVAPTGGGDPSGGASTGGVEATGGDVGGGAPPTGGTEASGATPPTGGTPATGGADTCVWSDGPSSADGELTCYWFGQGTARAPECPEFKTYCGYCGTETGERGDNQDPCPVGNIQNHVDNISTVHFAAFPLGEFAAGAYCGMCVEVSYDGYSIVATVVDACGSCNAGHIDLSLSAAEALGMTGWNGNPKTGVTWRAVGCPATGEIVATFNGGYQGQVYFQNVAFPIASAVAAGRTATMNNAFWDFGVVVAGEQVTLTDVVGHQVTGTIPISPSGGGIGAQFELSCQ